MPHRPCRAAITVIAVALILLPTAPPAAAETAGTPATNPIDAIGRFNRAGFRDRSHCTATLIAPDRALSAAHCLPAAPPARKAYVLPGLTPEGWPEALRVTGWRVAGGRRDVATLCLDMPAATAPLARSATGPQQGETLTIIGYATPRQYAQSHKACQVLTVDRAGAFALDCAVTPGTSGAPVLRDTPNGLEIVGIVSATNAQRSIAWDVSAATDVPACD